TAFADSSGGYTDAFVTKLNPAGSAPIYSTYLGGSVNDQGNAIAVDGSGKVYVTGVTGSSDFPTATAAQPKYGGGIFDAFVVKIDPDAPVFRLTITIAGTGFGVVTSSPSGIACGAVCTRNYDAGATVTLTPTADVASFFAGWSGPPDCAGGSVTLTADVTCTA